MSLRQRQRGIHHHWVATVPLIVSQTLHQCFHIQGYPRFSFGRDTQVVQCCPDMMYISGMSLPKR